MKKTFFALATLSSLALATYSQAEETAQTDEAAAETAEAAETTEPATEAAAADSGDALELTITADKVQFLFDVKEFTVKPGQKVKLTFVNPADSVNLQPHNLLIIKPGTKDAVGAAANGGLSDPEFLTTKDAVPDSEDVLFHTKLVKVGEEDVLEFTAPEEAGEYPYLCTYPGHWALMNGVMTVAE